MHEQARRASRSPARQSTSTLPLWARPVLRELRRMHTSGLLYLSLPDGSSETIGDRTCPPGERATLRITHPDFFRQVALFGDIGFAEAYLDGHWETGDLARLIAWAVRNAADTSTVNTGSRRRRFSPLNTLRRWNRIAHVRRHNSRANARRNIGEHYDLGNDFYRLWLDRSMTYSSARFTPETATLEEAQTEKIDALCRLLRLGPGDHLLEIGTGWGALAEHAATRYGCRVTTVTISTEQHAFVSRRIDDAGLAHLVEVRLQDYRDVTGTFDKIVSVEMLEAVGDRYLKPYFQTCHRLLKPHGLLALQYITVPDCRHRTLRKDVDFIQKHVFPGSLLLSVGRVNQALNHTGDLFLHHLEDLGPSYAETLRQWADRFNARLDEVRALGFDDRFIRKWNYYLRYCEAAFDTRNISVVQALYTRPNNPALDRPLRPHPQQAPPADHTPG